ncbi:MAG: lysine 2,3-aminomutase [Paracoccaceae bacterium]|jgi:lysine 2,3-aminomutase
MPLPGTRPATLRSGADLAAAGLAAETDITALDAVGAQYSIAIPAALAALIDSADPDDPIASQFVPDPAELIRADDELDDPIGDETHSPVRGLVHRYPDRVLLMPTMSCPVYCRYCFRRDRVGRAAGAPSADDLEAAYGYIEDRPEIREVILTGGDPLSLSDARLGRVIARLNTISHLNNIRIHTRVPVALPGRVTDGLIAALQSDIPVWMALHTNHVRELTDGVAAACDRLTRGGIPLLSQTVLLKGVNDSVDVLTELMRRLIALKVKPYYLHHPDRARGTAKFRLTLAEGQALVAALRGNISGLCQPTYVVDIPGGHGKAPAQDVTPAEDDTGQWNLRDFRGETHDYSDN